MIVRLRWFYFLYYASVGTFLSYFAPYLRGLGFKLVLTPTPYVVDKNFIIDALNPAI